MAVIGIGMDIVEISRIERGLERFGGRFIRRILSPAEMSIMPETPVRQAEFIAARFAAKEAAVKALGTGFAEGIAPAEIETLRDRAGAPLLRFSGKALCRAEASGVTKTFVTLTHTRGLAAAMVCLEGKSRPVSDEEPRQ